MQRFGQRIEILGMGRDVAQPMKELHGVCRTILSQAYSREVAERVMVSGDERSACSSACPASAVLPFER